MSTPRWGIGRRVGFRLGIIAGALLIFPFPVDVNPKSDGVVKWLNKPMGWAVSWFAQHALGLAEPSSMLNGSSTRTYDYVKLPAIAILAASGTVVWSVVDRRRVAYARLAAGALVVLRYYVGFTMLRYGFWKITFSHFLS